MNLTIPTSTLSTALKLSSSVADKKANSPLLGCVLLRATSKTLTLSATDTALSLSAELPADVRTKGAIALDAKNLLQYVARAPGDTIRIETDGARATVYAGKSHYKIAGHSDRDYPKIPAPPAGTEVDAVALFEMLSRASYAMSRDESRDAMRGTLIDVDGDRVTCASTDGHRCVLARRTTAFPRPNGGRGSIIPRGVAAFTTMLEGVERCSVSFDDRRMHVSHDGTTISAALIDGVFPPLEHVVPKRAELKMHAVTNRERLQAAIQRVSPLSSETCGLRVDSTQTGLRLLVADTEGQELVDEVDAEVDGEMKFALTAKYASDALSRMVGETVTIHMMDPLYPIVFEDCDDAGLTAVVMPRRY